VERALSEVAGASCNPVLLFGASAIVDRGDVLPAALTSAGGEVTHLGMPVDPGNLLMLGRWKDVPVIGVPSCARSPKVNGFDWVLERLLAGIPVTPRDVMEMGAGGLLAEIATRPTPREGKATPQRLPRIGAIVLAAGLSRRMGENKVLAEAGGKPLLSHVLASLAGIELEDIVVVTGRDAQLVAAQVARGRAVHNPQFAEGIASSVKAGIAALPGSVDAAFILLADMPLVDAASLARLAAAFNPTEHRSVCIPVFGGERGNPVLWGRQHFAALAALSGDQGGRALFDQLADEIAEVPVAHDGVLRDADTPEALAAIRSALNP
jgi:molybdenum cofactor cytidylyltransferase